MKPQHMSACEDIIHLPVVYVLQPAKIETYLLVKLVRMWAPEKEVPWHLSLLLLFTLRCEFSLLLLRIVCSFQSLFYPRLLASACTTTSSTGLKQHVHVLTSEPSDKRINILHYCDCWTNVTRHRLFDLFYWKRKEAIKRPSPSHNAKIK